MLQNVANSPLILKHYLILPIVAIVHFNRCKLYSNIQNLANIHFPQYTFNLKTLYFGYT